MAQATYLVLIDRGRNSSLFRKVSSSFIPPTPLLCLSLRSSKPLCLSICLYVSVVLSLSASVFTHLFVRLSVCLCLVMCQCYCASLSIHLHQYLSLLLRLHSLLHNISPSLPFSLQSRHYVGRGHSSA